MYHFLIEAGGLRQIARTNRDWHRQFRQDISELMQRHGFRLLREDGSLLYWSQLHENPVEVPAIMAVLAALQDLLTGHLEELLDYAVLLDYSRRYQGDAVVASLYRRLFMIREMNSLYATEEVMFALGSYVESVDLRGIHRLTGLGDGAAPVMPQFRSVMEDRANVSPVASVFAGDSPPPMLWVEGTDRCLTEAAIQKTLREQELAALVVHCWPGMVVEDLLVRILQLAAPFPPGEDRSETRILAKVLQYPGKTYLSREHRMHDLLAVVRQTLLHLVRNGVLHVLYLVDCDLLAASEGESVPFLAWPREAQPTGCIVVSAAEEPPHDAWRHISLVHHEDEAHSLYGGGDGFHSAYRYWAEWLADEETAAHGRYNREYLASQAKRKLTDRQVRVLYMLWRTGDHLSAEQREALCADLGISPAEQSRVLQEMQNTGVVLEQVPPQLHPAFRQVLEDAVEPSKLRDDDRELAALLARDVRGNRLEMPPRLWNRFVQSFEEDSALYLWHTIVHAMARSACTEDMFDTLVTPRSLKNRHVIELSRDSAVIQAHARRRVVDERFAAVAQRVHDAAEGGTQIPQEFCADYRLTLGEHELARGNSSAALAYGKKAVMEERRASTSGGYLLMARISLAHRRVAEAGQYLSFAREEGAADLYTVLTARTLEATRLYLMGNISRSRTIMEPLEEDLLAAGHSSAFHFIRFIGARILMDLGEYGAAAQAFQALAGSAGASGREEAASVAAAWAARAVLFTREYDRDAMHTLEGMADRAEAAFFIGEALCRSRRFHDALPWLQRAEEVEGQRTAVASLVVSWENGYASIEDLVIAGGTVPTELARLVRAYHAWALGHERNEESAERGVAMLYNLTRGGGGMAEDPGAALYNYLYSTILPETRSPDRDDRLTVLGKAVKLMQERASRIDVYHDKVRFLRQNEWNRRLLESARAGNLV